jgi:hypothetical protein
MTNIQIQGNIFWTVDSDGIFIFDKRVGLSERLPLEESIIWDLLLRENTFTELTLIYSNIIITSPEKAESIINECVEKWQSRGYLK